MATKLKATSKVLLFFITVGALASLMCFIFLASMLDVSFSDAFSAETYASSDDAMSDLHYYVDILSTLGNKYISEDYIKEGNLVEYERYKFDFDVRSMILDYNNENSKEKTNNIYDVSDQMIVDFAEVNPDVLSDQKNQEIIDTLNHFKILQGKLNNADGLVYYFKGEHTLLANMDQDKLNFLNKQVYYTFDTSGEEYSSSYNRYNQNQLFVDTDTLYVAFTDDYTAKRSVKWTSDMNRLQVYIFLMVGFVVLYVVGLFVLLVTVNKEMKWIFSGLYLELILLVNGLLFSGTFAILSVFHNGPPLEIFLIFSILVSLIGNYTALQVIKQYKEHRLKHTLLYKSFVWIIRIVGGFIQLLPYSLRMLPNIWNTRDFKTTFEYLDRIKEGEFDYIVKPKSSGLYADLIKSLDSVRDGMEVAVVNELKSERMKSELISNVSHDIRTPLTSIITYLDLLNNEDDNIKQKEYLGVLNHKVARLNMLVEDLFDAAKITSGNIPIELESVDLKQLLQQVIGEYYDQFEDRGLEIIETIDPVLVSADRKSLWRVIDNLIGNIVKYALENSRVYIEAIQLEDTVKIIFKNISHDALNMHAEELKLRFKRGDVARTTNGSGLGLAIAEDLIKLQGGQLDLIIDGDLFKAVVTLNHE